MDSPTTTNSTKHVFWNRGTNILENLAAHENCWPSKLCHGLLWQRWVPHQPWASQYISCCTCQPSALVWFYRRILSISNSGVETPEKLAAKPFFTQRGERILFESSPVKCRSKKQQPLQGQGPLSANLRSPDETFMVCSGLNTLNMKN